ncbi:MULTISPECIES: hypothetical protein [Polycladomyces]|jgi:hypothetical protein|uniref:Uncharacterized protein n=3 Tax=Polycladomyces TaxID=1348505 RepID=A0A8D5UE57_9BACL|nr:MULTISPECIES: hypothetical protein [Polycladomyces]MBN2909795.1 hypothetical protein [Polycladomyces sp. WAk]MDN4594107.1 hypothetical protein [Polycladomyces subterraneus]BCU81627.1 hypothetical protein JIR001_14100 [Polycladomyces abyssicola]
MYMVVILVLMCILAVRGVLYNKRTQNKSGFIIGGIFTAGLIGVTLLALYDTFVGLQ